MPPKQNKGPSSRGNRGASNPQSHRGNRGGSSTRWRAHTARGSRENVEMQDAVLGNDEMEDLENDMSIKRNVIRGAYQDLPKEVQKKVENLDSDLYQEISALFPNLPIEELFDLRGQDAPSFSHVPSVMNRLGYYPNVVVRIEYDGDLASTIGQGIDGSHHVRAYFHLHSQYPCISLQTDNELCLDLISGKELENLVEKTPLMPPNWKDKKSKSNNSFALRIGLADTHIPVSGADHDKLNLIIQGLTDGTFISNSSSDSLAAATSRGTTITIFFQQQESKNGVISDGVTTPLRAAEQFLLRMKMLMMLSRRLGDMWFYRIQVWKQQSSNDPVGTIGNSKVPRWLVTQFKCIEYSKDGKVVKYGKPMPSAWSALHAVRVWPNHGIQVMLQQLSVARQAQYQTRMLKSFVQSDERFEITAQFIELGKSASGRTTFAIFLFGKNTDIFTQMDVAEPSVDSRMDITWTEENLKEVVSNRHIFHGVVVPNVIKNGATFTCVAEGPFRKPKGFPTREHVPVHITAIDDPKSNGRRAAALAEFITIDPLDKPVGPDYLASFMCNRDPPGHQSILRDNTTTEQLDMFIRLIENSQPNQEQKDFAISTTQSKTGMEILFGPAGTGKSKTLNIIIGAHTGIGRKVLYTSGQNNPVEKAVEDFSKWADQHPLAGIEEWEILHFTGGANTIQAAENSIQRQEMLDRTMDQLQQVSQVNLVALTGALPQIEPTTNEKDKDSQRRAMKEMSQQLDDLFRDTIKNTRGPDYKHTLGWKLPQRIIAYSNRSESQEECRLANKYLSLKRDMRGARGQAKTDLRKILDLLEEKLAHWYITNEVKAVFCTNSMSCHMFLLESFSPAVLVIDEGAHMNLADMITPIAAFMRTFHEGRPNSILQVVIAGDYKQGKPFSAGAATDEAHLISKHSAFEGLSTNALKTHGSRELRTCYRFLPELLPMVKKIWYPNLESDDVVLKEDVDLQQTIKSYLSSTLGKAWSGVNRVAYDVSGPNVKAVVYEGTNSKINEEEAERVSHYAQELLDFAPPPNCCRILPKDIGIISVYAAQVKLIQGKLTSLEKQRSSPIGLNRIAVRTMAHAQGEQWPIVIWSMVASIGEQYPNPNKRVPLRFVGDPGSLCVGATRQRFHLAMFDDFRMLVQITRSGHPSTYSFKPFKDMMNWIYENQEIISVADWNLHLLGQELPRTNTFRIDTKLDLKLPVSGKRTIDSRPEPTPAEPMEPAYQRTRRGAFTVSTLSYRGRDIASPRGAGRAQQSGPNRLLQHRQPSQHGSQGLQDQPLEPGQIREP
ncbi:P-loop containing nucleoside triphosphate hydrolase protein [Dendryphion nanum]|uniref:P-loop containing nucleoside triphosphate hydrolase protein n=1 Tax=Dendryphion nanum TaxID=256645 RepID=A0A9P9ID06_9PLEO|nr:P-loop containing nucleoside triphosphate hydrolase protein [Dendryphion nanum]